jgi:hypothetical protein
LNQLKQLKGVFDGLRGEDFEKGRLENFSISGGGEVETHKLHCTINMEVIGKPPARNK